MKLLLCLADYHSDLAPRIIPLLQDHAVAVTTKYLDWGSLVYLAKAKGFEGVLIESEEIIDDYLSSRYSHFTAAKLPSAESYAGSITERSGITFLFLPSAERLYDSSYGVFLWRHYITKITAKAAWRTPPQFTFSVYNRTAGESSPAGVVRRFSQARLIAIDIETVRQDLQITCVGYCALFFSEQSGWTQETLVIPMEDEFNLALIRQLNLLPVPKIFQNGKYDNSYFLRWGAPVSNWLWDTQTMFHCWYAELPKRLDFLASFFIRDFEYWKHESQSGQQADLHRYNAKDAWATAVSLLAMIQSAPDWAINNYKQEFPLNMPSLWAEMVGIKCDMPRLELVKEELELESASELKRLQVSTNLPHFNPRSPKHMLWLFAVLGAKGMTSAAEKHLIRVKRLHPLNALLIDRINKWKKSAKLLSTYLVPEKFLGGRILYAINPHGTDTGRQASKAHHFWCGLQIQNIPRGNAVKQLFVSDAGWLFGEADGEQAEARYVAYLSGDKGLIETVCSPKDFHSLNGERFFGIPYEEVLKNKTLRDLTKRVNHGCNYNMGPAVLLETMGIDKVFEAKRLLALPPQLSAFNVCEHLIHLYESAYPAVKTTWYTAIKHEIALTHKLTGATSWTRYCFGNPSGNKPDLNAYVAHVPQSLNAMVLNKGFLAVFEQIQLVDPDNFRILAQIHDSILFTYRIGYEHYAHKVKELMEIPVQITGADKVSREMIVPVALKFGKERWSDL